MAVSVPSSYTTQANYTDSAAEKSRKDSHPSEHRSEEHSSSSFSRLLASYSKDSDEDDSGASSKPAKQANSDDGVNDENAANAAQSAQPSQFLMLSGLLGLLRDGQSKLANSSDAENANSSEENGSQASGSQAEGADAATGTATNAPAAVVSSLLAGLGTTKGLGKGTETKAGQLAALTHTHANILGIPIDVQQTPDDAPDAAENSETGSKAGNTAAANINAADSSAGANSANGAAASSDPLAFTMSITGDGDNPAAGAPDGASGEAISPAGQFQQQLEHAASTAIAAAGAEATTNGTAEHGTGTQGSNLLTADATQFDSSRKSDRAAAAEEPQATSSADAEEEISASRNESVHNVQVQLQTDENQRINVQMTSLGGELRVSVRSADPNLTQALQNHMPELTNRLEQQQYRAEVWIPRSSEASDSGASNARNFNSQGDSSGQDQSGRRQNGRQNNDPDWLEEEA